MNIDISKLSLEELDQLEVEIAQQKRLKKSTKAYKVTFFVKINTVKHSRSMLSPGGNLDTSSFWDYVVDEICTKVNDDFALSGSSEKAGYVKVEEANQDELEWISQYRF